MGDRLSRLVARITDILTPGEGLLEKSITGGIWMTLLNVSGRIFQILTVIVLARLLTPRAFGIVGIGMLIIVGLQRLSKLGLDEALIYNKSENVDRYLNTAWVMDGVRGAVIALLLFLTAPLIADFFREPTVADVLRVMAIGPLIYALKSPAIVYFRKDMKFGKEFAYEVTGEIVYFAVAVGYALLYPTFWALAFGYIAREATRTLMSYLLTGYRPWPAFKLELAREMFDYGKWITGGSIMNYIRNEGDDAFIGWILGSASLGLYQMAYRLSNAPATEVTHVISRVTFPAYSQVQDDIPQLRAAFFKSVRFSAVVAAPMAVGIAVISPTFVMAVLGSEWMGMVVPMQLLALYGLGRAYASSFGSVWMATGHADYLTKLQALTIVLMAIPLYPAVQAFGISGAALVIAVVYVGIMLPIDSYLAVKAVDGSLRRLATEFAYPLPAAGFMGVVVLLVQETVTGLPVYVDLPLLILVGAVSYVLAVAVMERSSSWGIIREVRDLRRSI